MHSSVYRKAHKHCEVCLERFMSGGDPPIQFYRDYDNEIVLAHWWCGLHAGWEHVKSVEELRQIWKIEFYYEPTD